MNNHSIASYLQPTSMIINKNQNGGKNHNNGVTTTTSNNNNNNATGNSNLNNNNNNGNVTRYDLSQESGIKNRLPNLRYHVFISKETTKELSDYILPEPWGDENGLLYKYLDYVWRCQLFDRQIKKFFCRNEGKLVFHSGLQRRSDGEFVYLLLIRNDADSNKKVDQKWRVALGIQNGLHSRNMSFVTKQELMKHYWRHDESLLPQRTLFYHCEKDLIFNKNYRFEIDWEERLRTCKNRIYKTLSNLGNRKGSSCIVDENVLPLKELQRRFESETVKSIALARANPRQGVPQAFIESKSGGYRLELLIPLTLHFNNRVYYFALALRPHHDDQIYEGMSILTREMAYANARLVGSIDSSWLTARFASDNAGAAQHCSCTCHNFCNAGINADHVHNLSDHKRKYNNEIPYDPQSSSSSSSSATSTSGKNGYKANNNNSSKKGMLDKLQHKNNNVISPRHHNNSMANAHHATNFQQHQQQQQQQQHPHQQHPHQQQQQQQQQQHHHHQHLQHAQPPQASPLGLSNAQQTSHATGTPTLNGTHSNDSNPYMIGVPFNSNNNNPQMRNPLHQFNAPPFNMPNMPPPFNMYPYATTTTPYALPMQSPSNNNAGNNNAGAGGSNPNSRPVNTATTNPFQFVTPTNHAGTPMLAPYNASTNLASYATSSAGSASANAYNLSSILSSAANPALNAAFLASVPNVAGGMQGATSKPSPLSFLTNPSGMASVGNTSLPPYGIPTIAPPCLAVSSVSNLPIAQMSGPQSIGSSVSSVPLFAKSLALNAHKTHPNSNGSAGINGHSSSSTSSSSIHITPLSNARVNAALVGNSSASNTKASNGSHHGNNNNNVSSNLKNGAASEEQTDNKKLSETGGDTKTLSMSKIDTDIEIKRDADDVPGMKQGFTDDMFADASPRTKEIFNGLTFDEEDEVYSLQPSRGKNKLQTGNEEMKHIDGGGGGGGGDAGKTSAEKREHAATTSTLPKSKSFCLPPSPYTAADASQALSAAAANGGGTTHDWKSASFSTLQVQPPPPLMPSSAPESPSASTTADGLYLRDLSHSSRTHSDGMQRVKSAHNMGMVNKRYGHTQSARGPYYHHGVAAAPAPMYYDDHDAMQNGETAGAASPAEYRTMYGGMMHHSNESAAYMYDKKRIFKSRSHPSLSDMMQMQVGTDQFQEFQQMSVEAQGNTVSENVTSSKSGNEHRHRAQQITTQPIQENHPSVIMDVL